jgi:hypothetical protein
MADSGISAAQIARELGKTKAGVWKALNPEKTAEMNRRSNRRPERRAAKGAWNRRRWQEHQERHQDRDPEIPGLLPLWDVHRCIADFARVDIADWLWLREYSFSRVGNGYAKATIDGRIVYLHHLLLGHVKRGSGLQTDHINRDPLDNRRQNLRIVTPKENQHNRGGVYERCWWRQQQAA